MSEILLIDNASSDISSKIACQWCAENPGLASYIRREQNNLGAARAEAIQLAKSPYLIFTDADCSPSQLWIGELWRAFYQIKQEDNFVAAFGAPAAPSVDGSIGVAWNLMTSSFLGHLGSTQAWRPRSNTKVEHVPTANVIYDREKVLAVGNFSTQLADVCEDVELNRRLCSRGYSLYFGPQPSIEHAWAENWTEWFVKLRRYGAGQVVIRQLHADRSLPTDWGRQDLPVVLGLFMSICLLGGCFFPVLWLGVAAYVLGVTFVSLWIVIRHQSLNRLVLVALAFFITHLAYSLGAMSGTVWSLRRSLKKKMSNPVKAVQESL